jgi:hypothetical protein
MSTSSVVANRASSQSSARHAPQSKVAAMVNRGTNAGIPIDGDARLHILRRTLSVAAVTLAVLVVAFVVLVVSSYFELSQAQEHHHPPADAQHDEKSYSSWMMPASPTDPAATSRIVIRPKSAIATTFGRPSAGKMAGTSAYRGRRSSKTEAIPTQETTCACRHPVGRATAARCSASALAQGRKVWRLPIVDHLSTNRRRMTEPRRDIDRVLPGPTFQARRSRPDVPGPTFQARRFRPDVSGPTFRAPMA